MDRFDGMVEDTRIGVQEREARSIPFLDLVTPNLALEDELVNAFRASLRAACFVGGAPVAEFEEAFAGFCQVQEAVAVSSGTDALRFALIAVGVKAGDVVITVPNTFIATSEAISQAGALPEFVDVNDRTYNLSPGALEEYLKEHCKRDAEGRLLSLRSGLPVRAVVPVHLYGQMADMDAILELAERFGLLVVEDACQAHGAEYFSAKRKQWMRAGSLGAAAAFSFYPGKNLGALGEGGAVTTNDPRIAQQVRLLRDHGQSKKYLHTIEGYNGRLDSIQCAFLKAKLAHLENWNLQRRKCAAEYQRLLSDNTEVVLPYEPEWARSAWHLYVVRLGKRDTAIEHLKQAGIGTGLHYPIPLHLQKAYVNRGYCPATFPVAERVASEALSLPMYPHLNAVEQARVATELRAVAGAQSEARKSH